MGREPRKVVYVVAICSIARVMMQFMGKWGVDGSGELVMEVKLSRIERTEIYWILSGCLSCF